MLCATLLDVDLDHWHARFIIGRSGWDQSRGCDLSGCRGDVLRPNILLIGQTTAWRSEVCASRKLMRLIRIEIDCRRVFGDSSNFILSAATGASRSKASFKQ
jgi:hypothetical protein